MRRHAFLIITTWLMLFVFMAQPVAEATGCVPLPYTFYVPSITSSSESVRTLGQFSIIQPRSTVNLVSNPSPRSATTGYNAVSSASLALVATKQRRGSHSLEVTPASGTGSGVYYALPANTTSGQDYTVSVDFWGPAGLTYLLYVGNTSGTVIGSSLTITGDERWHRYELTYTESSSASRRIYVIKNGHASTTPFYIDGLQFENLPYATTYCDGYQKGCAWVSTPDASNSQRSSQERSGGRLVDLQSLNAYLVSQQGTGMPDITNSFTPYAGIDGGFYQRRSVKARTFTIAMSISGSSVADWHIKRQAMIDLVKPDLVYPTQPFVLVYDDGGDPVSISCYYDGGLEMADGKREIETIAIRCLAVDPLWKFDGNAGTSLNVTTSITNANGIVARSPSGVWAALGSGVSGGTVFAIAQGLDGIYYVGGSFTSAGGVANTRAIASYDPSTGQWSAMGTGATNVGDHVYDITIDSNGFPWVVGNFTNMGGVASSDYVSRWRTDAPGWSTPAGGTIPTIITSTVPLRACHGTDGAFYLPTLGTGIYRYSSLTWTLIGTTNGASVYSCALAPDGTILVGHDGTAIDAVNTPSRVGRWNPVTSSWNAAGETAVAGSIREFSYDTAGNLYAAASGGTTALIHYNGSEWEGAGEFDGGLTIGYSVGATISGGSVFVGGNFDSASGITLLDRFAEWNGSSAMPPDIDLPGTATVYKVKMARDGTLLVGYNTTGTATAAATTTVTNNGSAETYPKIIFTATNSSYRIYQIINKTTGKAIYLDAYISSGETITLDLTPGAISFTSTFQGNMMPHVLPGSTLAGWSLAPGDNVISIFAGSSNVSAVMTWPERCWSIDASGV